SPSTTTGRSRAGCSPNGWRRSWDGSRHWALRLGSGDRSRWPLPARMGRGHRSEEPRRVLAAPRRHVDVTAAGTVRPEVQGPAVPGERGTALLGLGVDLWAKVHGLPPRLGRVAAGRDVDVVAGADRAGPV